MAAAFDLSSLEDALPHQPPPHHHQQQLPHHQYSHHQLQHTATHHNPHLQPQHAHHPAYFQHRSPVGQPIPGLSGVRRAGVSKFFSSSKGYGFAIDNNPQDLGGQEVFVHFSAIAGKGGFKSLAEGEEVEYEIVGGPKGYQASNLTGPGGRPVVGDPKARLAKGPPFPPFSPLNMALPPQYLTDPYHQQHSGGMYPPSPYTQHIVYVPTTALHNPALSSHPSSHHQYSYGLPPSSHSQPPSSVLSSPPGSTMSSSQLSSVGGQYNAQAGQGGAGYGNGGGGYQSISPVGYPSLQTSGLGSRGPSGVHHGTNGTNGHNGGGYPGAFGQQQASPTSRNFSLPGGPGSPISGAGPSLTFAPFNSPPSYNHAPLFNAPPSFTNPTLSPPLSATAFNLAPQQQQQHKAHSASSTSRIASNSSNNSSISVGAVGSGSAIGSTSTSSLFGTSPGSAGVVGTPRSGAGTPRESTTTSSATAMATGLEKEKRVSTPLGNGTIAGANGSSSPFAPVLYTSSNDF